MQYECTINVPKSKENPDGSRRQKRHYPSRTECMVCHSRAANWVLGLTELQMNKVHDYGAVQDNQLRTLEHLGILRANWIEEGQIRKTSRAQLEVLAPLLLATPLEPFKKLVD